MRRKINKYAANQKRIRKAQGLSQEQLAALTDLTRGQIASYEENRAEPNFDNLIKISRALGSTPTTLIGFIM